MKIIQILFIKDLQQFGIDGKLLTVAANYFMSRYSSQTSILGSLFVEVEEIFELTAGMGLNIFKHLAYHKYIEIDIESRIHICGQTATQTTSARTGDIHYA